jgi:hypothetical protein
VQVERELLDRNRLIVAIAADEFRSRPGHFSCSDDKGSVWETRIPGGGLDLTPITPETIEPRFTVMTASQYGAMSTIGNPHGGPVPESAMTLFPAWREGMRMLADKSETSTFRLAATWRRWLSNNKQARVCLRGALYDYEGQGV